MTNRPKAAPGWLFALSLLMILGLISDTHGLLRASALRTLTGVDRIIHAGDVGRPEILAALEDLAPVVAVRGNVDVDGWAMTLPLTAKTVVEGRVVYVLHDVKDLKIDPAAMGVSIVVSGHSHQPMQEFRAGVLYINPGSAGPRRFKLPITVARLDLRAKPWNVEFIDVSQN